jgi:hypothetical protein
MVAVSNVELVPGSIRPQERLAEFAAIHPRNSCAIDCYPDVISLAPQFKPVPFAGGFHPVFAWFNKVIDGAGVVVPGTGGIVDSDLETIKPNVLSGSWFEGEGAKENTAITTRADFEVQLEDKVPPLFLVDHHVGATLVRVDAALLNGSLALLLIARDPAIERFSVKQELPASLLLLACELIVLTGDNAAIQEQE